MPPLSLDSIRWAQLTHAYGSATDTPKLLRQLSGSPDDDVWSDLCGSVVHQGDVSEAAYAALPHVVAAARMAPVEDRVMHLAFAASVLDGRVRKSCPDDLKTDFDDAIEAVRSMAMETLETAVLQDADLPYVFEAIAASNNLPILARILEQFSNDEFTFECPDCGSWLYISTDVVPFRVFAEDPVSHPDSRSVLTESPQQPRANSQIPSSGAEALPWLCSLSDAQGNTEFQEKLVSLYGDSECPKCSRALNLYVELERVERETELSERKA